MLPIAGAASLFSSASSLLGGGSGMFGGGGGSSDLATASGYLYTGDFNVSGAGSGDSGGSLFWLVVIGIAAYVFLRK